MKWPTTETMIFAFGVQQYGLRRSSAEYDLIWDGPVIVVKNRKSALEEHVPFALVKQFTVMTERHRAPREEAAPIPATARPR